MLKKVKKKKRAVNVTIALILRKKMYFLFNESYPFKKKKKKILKDSHLILKGS